MENGITPLPSHRQLNVKVVYLEDLMKYMEISQHLQSQKVPSVSILKFMVMIRSTSLHSPPSLLIHRVRFGYVLFQVQFRFMEPLTRLMKFSI